jgi:N-acetyl-gamma-glutamyl-phosphate reductase
MSIRVFVDGEEGTTGLQIHSRLAARADVELLRIDPHRRKEPEARRQLLNEADVAFLCLPDDASRESVSLVSNPHTRVVDASTAFRTHPDWVYGIPELSSEHRDRIAHATRVSVPGCHASGCVVALWPLIAAGVVPRGYPVTFTSVTGYSGGGKKLIGKYEGPRREELLGPRHYALGLRHKHLPEVRAQLGLDHDPLFIPILGPIYRGMAVSVPILTRLLPRPTTRARIHDMLASHYAGQRFVRVMPSEVEPHLDEGALDPTECDDTNRLDLFVFGHDDQILLVSRLDNLGKGASGAAVQCMNVMMGLPEDTGLSA